MLNTHWRMAAGISLPECKTMLGKSWGIFSGLVHSLASRAILVQPSLIAQELQAVGKVVKSTKSLREMSKSRTKISSTITNTSKHVQQHAPHLTDFVCRVLTSRDSACLSTS